jgi:hypothetical protein
MVADGQSNIAKHYLLIAERAITQLQNGDNGTLPDIVFH